MTREATIVTRYVDLTAQFGGEFDDLRAWLTAPERDELARFRHPLRRRQWLVGRWITKQLICETLYDAALNEIQILTRDGRGLGSRPIVSVRGCQLDGSLSISHTQRGVLVAVTATAAISVGVDLADNVPCDERFQRLWFTAGERRWINNDPRRAALAWAIKEAVYKACQTGQGWSPRLVEVAALPAGQFACTFHGRAVDELQLSIEEIDSQLAVIATVAEPSWSTEKTYSTELSLASCS
jgi:phosphopantetheinyl transferase